MIGETLGNFKIIEEISRGGVAIIYKGFQTNLNRYVAIKVLPPQLTTDPDLVERFRREAQAVAKLNHPNVCQVYDVNIKDNTHYIVMELIDGETLREIIQKEAPLSLKENLTILSQVGDALSHAHRNGIIHRDIKPENIMIDREGRVKIMDFGVARITNATWQTKVGMIMGTPEYMSPEQVKGERVDERSDIYSLGVMLYEMLTGELPFKGDDPFSIAFHHVNSEPLPLTQANPGLPKVVEKVVMKTLAKGKEDRYQNVDELVKNFRRAAKQARKMTRVNTLITPRPLVPVAKKRSPNKKLIVGIIALLVVTVALISLSAGGLLSKEKRALRYLEQGEKLYHTEEYQKAIPNYKRAVELNPTLEKALSGLAKSYEKVGDYQQTIAGYSKVLELDEDNFPAHLGLGRSYEKLGDYEQALKIYQRALELGFDGAELHYKIGEIYRGLSNYPQALSEYQEALNRDPNYVLAYKSSALIHDDQNRYKDALAMWRKVAERTTDGSLSDRAKEEIRRLESAIEEAARPKVGSLKITTNPSSAKIYLDGKHIGKSPQTISEVSIDTHQITAQMDGYAEATRTVEVAPGENIDVSLTLKQLFGSIAVNSVPWGKVFLDGKEIGETPLTKDNIPAGKHQIRISREGHIDAIEDITIKSNEEIRVSVKLEEG